MINAKEMARIFYAAANGAEPFSGASGQGNLSSNLCGHHSMSMAGDEYAHRRAIAGALRGIATVYDQIAKAEECGKSVESTNPAIENTDGTAIS